MLASCEHIIRHLCSAMTDISFGRQHRFVTAVSHVECATTQQLSIAVVKRYFPGGSRLVPATKPLVLVMHTLMLMLMLIVSSMHDMYLSPEGGPTFKLDS